jgi:hypothetical protein
VTEAEKQHLKKLLVGTAAYYGQSLRDDVLLLYVEDLTDLPFEAVCTALKEIRRDPKTTRCPLPAVIRNHITPAETDENKAIEAVSRIIDAVSRFGWNNLEAAKEFIGELGWQIVTRDGGWQNVCESMNPDNLGVYRAQWKQLALTQIQRAKAGTLNTAPALPAPNCAIDVGKLLPSMPGT